MGRNNRSIHILRGTVSSRNENEILDAGQLFYDKTTKTLKIGVDEGSAIKDSPTITVADRAITTDKMNYSAVKADNIQDGAVTTAKIYDGAVTANKIAKTNNKVGINISGTADNADKIKIEENYKPIKNVILDIVYPVGSIYIGCLNISPSSFLGGSWERLKNGALWAKENDYDAMNIVPVDGLLPKLSGNLEIRGYWRDRSPIINYNGVFEGVYSTENKQNLFSDTDAVNPTRIISFNSSKSNARYSGPTDLIRPTAYHVFMWRRTA